MKNTGRQRRKLFTYGWIAAIAITVTVLIYWELTAVLYILATLGVTGLLIVVAFDDFGPDSRPSNQIINIDDAAAIGSGISSSVPKKQL